MSLKNRKKVNKKPFFVVLFIPMMMVQQHVFPVGIPYGGQTNRRYHKKGRPFGIYTVRSSGYCTARTFGHILRQTCSPGTLVPVIVVTNGWPASHSIRVT